MSKYRLIVFVMALCKKIRNNIKCLYNVRYTYVGTYILVLMILSEKYPLGYLTIIEFRFAYFTNKLTISVKTSPYMMLPNNICD